MHSTSIGKSPLVPKLFCDAKKGVPDIEGERDTILNGVVPKVIRDKTFIAPKDNGSGGITQQRIFMGLFLTHTLATTP